VLHAASPKPSSLLLIPGAEHNDVPEVGGNPYLQALREFIEQIFRKTDEKAEGISSKS
jgi:hypothetical protein